MICDAIRIGVVPRRLEDGPSKQHLFMNAGRLHAWAVLKASDTTIKRAISAANQGFGMVVCRRMRRSQGALIVSWSSVGAPMYYTSTARVGAWPTVMELTRP